MDAQIVVALVGGGFAVVVALISKIGWVCRACRVHSHERADK